MHAGEKCGPDKPASPSLIMQGTIAALIVDSPFADYETSTSCDLYEVCLCCAVPCHTATFVHTSARLSVRGARLDSQCAATDPN